MKLHPIGPGKMRRIAGCLCEGQGGRRDVYPLGEAGRTGRGAGARAAPRSLCPRVDNGITRWRDRLNPGAG